MESALPKFTFTLAEIMVMENLFIDIGDEPPSQKFCKALATCFSCSTRRTGKSSITWNQVQSWFKDRQKTPAAKVTSSPFAFKGIVDPLDANVDKNQNEISSPVCPQDNVLTDALITSKTTKISQKLEDATTTGKATETSQKPKGERVVELPKLVFEAFSRKDSAWYDVASFLKYRVIASGDLEVHVRFSGFNYEEDEWVSVRSGLRERSLPLEPSDCHRVKAGDLVLCFRESDDEAIYCDARIVEIQRKIHDNQVCSCVFLVCYDTDNSEEKVQLSNLCCRPA